LELSIDAILAVAAGMKEDLQRQANQGVLRNDMNRALGALASINAIDNFVYRLQVRSGSLLGLPKTPRARKSPLRKHLELEAERKKFLRANGRALESEEAKDAQQLPSQLLLPNAAGPIPAKKRKSA
jgi:hypothetical protein